MGDSELLLEARALFNLATWDGSIKGWMERDIDQYPKPGTVGYALNEWNPAFDPEKYKLSREDGQRLLAASREALEIFRKDPSLVDHFLDPYRRFLHDEHETISRVILRILEKLVDEGRITIERDRFAFAGFAYLFYSMGPDGIRRQIAPDTRPTV